MSVIELLRAWPQSDETLSPSLDLTSPRTLQSNSSHSSRRRRCLIERYRTQRSRKRALNFELALSLTKRTSIPIQSLPLSPTQRVKVSRRWGRRVRISILVFPQPQNAVMGCSLSLRDARHQGPSSFKRWRKVIKNVSPLSNKPRGLGPKSRSPPCQAPSCSPQWRKHFPWARFISSLISRSIQLPSAKESPSLSLQRQVDQDRSSQSTLIMTLSRSHTRT